MGDEKWDDDETTPPPGRGAGVMGEAIARDAKDRSATAARTKRKDFFMGVLLFLAQVCAR
jgi:hypothetical protein